MYLVDARMTPEGEILSIEEDRIHVEAERSNELRMSYATDENGNFDFIVPNGEYYLAFQSFWEPLDPKMIGTIWLSKSSGKPTFGTISFIGKPRELTIKMHNNGYESKKESFTVYTVQPGDTLWTIAEEYYGSGDQWALIARLNEIELLSNKSILIDAGQIIKIPRKGWYETDEVAQNLRGIVHSGEFNKTITYTNDEYGYQVTYPGFWILKDGKSEGTLNIKGALNKKVILGPTIHLRMQSFVQQPADVEIAVYDNATGMTLEEFLIDKDYASKYTIEIGNLTTEPFANGGTLITAGTSCGLYCHERLVFFENSKIYFLSFPVLWSLEEDEKLVYKELLGILNSFDFIN
tara:strand:- start:59 stop:1108 length:1050 start_codon:yes stop_codon:yes gene_type:complete